MGFIGSNYVKYHLKTHPEDEITILDKLTYAGKKQNLYDVDENFEFIKGDICDSKAVMAAMNECDQVIHFAAESHVDRSIDHAMQFIQTNVFGTGILLDAARRQQIDRFIQISTDEVYGSIESGSFKEDNVLNPSSPYSSSKAAADLLALSYFKTYNLPVVITRSTNNYGPCQHREKLIPLMITNAMDDAPLPIYGSGKNIRDWTFVEDNCRGIDIARMKGKSGNIYNIGSHEEYTNIEIIQMILEILQKPSTLIKFVSDRPGHDFRYSVNTEKISRLGWNPQISLHSGIEQTIQWYRKNPSW